MFQYGHDHYYASMVERQNAYHDPEALTFIPRPPTEEEVAVETRLKVNAFAALFFILSGASFINFLRYKNTSFENYDTLEPNLPLSAQMHLGATIGYVSLGTVLCVRPTSPNLTFSAKIAGVVLIIINSTAMGLSMYGL
jgi:hypothetical protein